MRRSNSQQIKEENTLTPQCTVAAGISNTDTKSKHMQANVNRQLKEKILCYCHVITSAKFVDAEYEKMTLQMSAIYPNIDPFLLAKAAMLRKRNPAEKNRQHFWIDIHYREGVNDNEKGPKLWKEAGIPPAYHRHNHFALDIQTDLEEILAISADRDIKMISGDVFPQ